MERNDYIVTADHLPQAFDGFRIAHVSDLHNDEMGDGNGKLLEMLRDSQPDIIAITGDMIDSRDTNVGIALEFAAEAVKIAPCYYVPGNHESRVAAYESLKRGLTELGVTVLENRKVELTRNGSQITLLGVMDPSFRLFGDDGAVMEAQLQALAPGTEYTVLLSHRPELIEVYARYGMDLVLAGHAHGGQFRVPLVGGLYAPHQGLFPEYDSGLTVMGNTHMIVSRGIGNSIIPLRFNNPPEVILITLKCS